MSLEKDITEIKKIKADKPIFKAASQDDVAKRNEDVNGLTPTDKADIVRRVRKSLDYQFEAYPWTAMLRDTGLTPTELEWALNHLFYTVGCDDPKYKINY